jgi:hypothetical protein
MTTSIKLSADLFFQLELGEAMKEVEIIDAVDILVNWIYRLPS